MLYHLEQEVNSSMSLKKQLEERNSQENIRSLFRVLSKGLLLNIEQFIKSRKWMNGVSANSIKNITITSINIFPEDQEKKSSISLQQEYASKQISSDSLNIYETINIPEGEFKLGENDEINGTGDFYHLRKNYSDTNSCNIEFIPGLILGKLNFISLSLTSINKMLEMSKITACSETT
ncbi:uncharacterized protein [Halyomorpha halys]|nr:uncharacterized protein LOC106678769 isoform X2 [Halyomorpha halys]